MKAVLKAIDCVDLFCGLGGLTHGLVRGGIRVTAGFDLDPACRFAYESNNPSAFHERDVRSLPGSALNKFYEPGRLRLLAGCAPCQPFSTYSRIGRQNRADAMWDLVVEFGRLVRELEPELVTMENVPQLIHHRVFLNFLSDLAGYWVSHNVVECSRYAVPQSRKRLVVLASKLGPIELADHDVSESPASAPTVRSAIGALRPLAAGETDPHDALHSACRLSDINLRRIRSSKPGGTWRDWDEALVATCHRRNTGSTFPSVYGRMTWDEPSPTITTQCFGYGNGRFGHPEQDRAITLREAAILQTFPTGYRFLPEGEKVRFHVLGRLIGNAVPVRLGEVIASSMIRHVEVVRSGSLKRRRFTYPCVKEPHFIRSIKP
jgi:DNA (cytosine-5)-methyltransferase 1